MTTPQRLIATSRVAEVFDYDDDATLKLYRTGAQRSSVEREAANARAAYVAGVPTPQVFEVVTVDGRHGIVFERIEGPTMLEALASHPEKALDLACTLADIQAEIHKHQRTSIGPLRTRLRERIDRARVFGVGPRECEAALAALDQAAEGSALCHGDFHPGNVLMSNRGPIVIDWLDATAGDPHADVARTSLILRYAGGPFAVRDAFHTAWFERYVERVPGAAAGVAAWMLPVAAARLGEDLSSSEREKVVAIVQESMR